MLVLVKLTVAIMIIMTMMTDTDGELSIHRASLASL